jgi:curved DNA-binding protein CbpA
MAVFKQRAGSFASGLFHPALRPPPRRRGLPRAAYVWYLAVMTEFDPYFLLGVARNASAQSIKAAYRQRVQTTHPDRGGDASAFVALVQAFGLLSDPELRRIYDETGIVDEQAVKNYRRDVIKILVDMFDAAIETAVATGLDLGKVDFVSQMATAVRTGLAEAKLTLDRAERDIGALSALSKRIRRRDERPNIFAARLEAQIVARTEQRAQIRRRVSLLDTAIVELSNYESEIELMTALDTAS